MNVTTDPMQVKTNRILVDADLTLMDWSNNMIELTIVKADPIHVEADQMKINHE